jgi:hypothetical protein
MLRAASNTKGEAMRYAVVRADGTHELFETEGRLQLDQIQKLIAAPSEEQGFVEAVSGPSLSILINENGKYLPLATNHAVTQFARANRLIWPNDDIRGDCVITGSPDDRGYEQDVDDDVLNTILSYI